jgi:hypothetical protein
VIGASRPGVLLPRAMNALRLAAAPLAVVLVACGGGPKPPPMTADEAPAPSASSSSEAVAAEPSAAEAPAAEAAPAGPMSCVANAFVCSEMTLGGKEASEAKDRCKAATGEPRDGECSRENIAATCTIETRKVALYYYRAKNPEEMRGILSGGQKSCDAAGGTFAASAAAKPGKKRPNRKKK